MNQNIMTPRSLPENINLIAKNSRVCDYFILYNIE